MAVAGLRLRQPKSDSAKKFPGSKFQKSRPATRLRASVLLSCFGDNDGIHPRPLERLNNTIHLSSCCFELSVELQSDEHPTMAYIAPIHRPSSVRHALKLNFLTSDDDCLVVA
jgi:hypothetical protein